MSIAYTPQDIAVFLRDANLTQSGERDILRTIWEHEPALSPLECREDFYTLQLRVEQALNKIEGWFGNLDELNALLEQTDHAYSLTEASIEQSEIEHFFKVIKLNLVYTDGKNYRRIKMRRLLSRFGYKRRSSQLIDRMQAVLAALDLEVFLRGQILCDLSRCAIDDMITLRLKKEDALSENEDVFFNRYPKNRRRYS